MTTPSPDIAAISTIVISVGALADRHEFDALSRLYADEFLLDYSSLNGEAAASKTPLQLMSEWEAVLPGFDRTQHALSDIKVSINGNIATAQAKVSASHWLGEAFWQLRGHYEYQLKKIDQAWKITAMTLVFGDESGSRDIFGPAIEAAKQKDLAGCSLTIAARNIATVRQFFHALEAEDISGLVDLFAEDGVQINPYNGGVFPAGARGKQALRDYWTPVPANFDGMKFPIDEVLATQDPGVVYVRYRGEITLKDGQGVYQNNYYSTFRFDKEGKIEEYVEIFDPVVAARAFGLMDKMN